MTADESLSTIGDIDAGFASGHLTPVDGAVRPTASPSQRRGRAPWRPFAAEDGQLGGYRSVLSGSEEWSEDNRSSNPATPRPTGIISRALAGRLATRIAGDILAVAAGFGLFDGLTGHVAASQLALGVGYVAVAAIVDLTHVRREWSRIEELVLAAKVAFVALLATTAFIFLVGLRASRIAFLSVAMAMVLIRPMLGYALHRRENRAQSPRTVIAVCDDEEYETLVEAIAHREVAPLRILSRIGGEPANEYMHHLWAAADASQLKVLCRLHRPWRLVVGRNGLDSDSLAMALSAVNEEGVGVRSLPRLFEEEFGRVPLTSLDLSWFLFDIGPVHRVGYRAVRRVVDLVAALATGLVCLLILPFVAAAIAADSRGPIFYRQTRVGQYGVPFVLLKFRTMRTDAEIDGPAWATRRDSRVTRVGRFLRRSRLDELPQSLNLLKGQMSLIGPRPERPEFIDQLSVEIPYFQKRHLIKPGITGWAQVHEGYGSSIGDMRRKLERDLYYLKYQSVGLDLRIITATVAKVLRLQGQ